MEYSISINGTYNLSSQYFYTAIQYSPISIHTCPWISRTYRADKVPVKYNMYTGQYLQSFVHMPQYQYICFNTFVHISCSYQKHSSRAKHWLR